MDLSRTLSATVIAYGLLAVGMLRWHFSYGPPYYQTTLGLLVVFAVSAALVGLLSVWAALGMLHWAKRASWFTVAASAMAGLWLLFFEWNQYLIWQMVVLLAVQMACLVVVLGICRVFGLGVLRDKSTSGKAGKSSQLSIRDLLVLTAALAIFFAVLGIGHPVELGATIYGILFAGGCCAAFAALTAFWVSFSNSSLVLRLAVFAIVAPIGGGVYATASYFESLLFNWRWYSGVTALQMLFMMVPFAVVRAYGISFAGDKPQTIDIGEPYSSTSGV